MINNIEFKGGAFRQSLMPFYGGIPFPALQRLAEAFATGREKYDTEILQRNWHKGDLAFFLDCFNHTIAHLYKWYQEIEEGVIHDGDEDHLGHAMANIAMLCWAAQQGKIPDKTTQYVPTYEDTQGELLPLDTNLKVTSPPAGAVPVAGEKEEEIKNKLFSLLKLNKRG